MTWTYPDAVEHLLDLFDLEDTARNRRQCRRAVDECYRELPQRAQWSYFDRHLTLTVSAPYSTEETFKLTEGLF